LRFICLIITLLSLSLIGISAPAHAQFEDIGGILEDILGGGQLPGQTPIYGATGIENIPVLIRYDISPDYEDHMLVVSAYAPNDPNGTTQKPQMLGQTRLLLTGLEQPLKVTIPVPRNVTKDLTFSRITADVVDPNENQVLTTERDGVYRGNDAAELTLRPVFEPTQSPSSPSYTDFETIKGEVSFHDRKVRLNGSRLTIQLLENALAGGNSVTIAAEKIISLDGQSLPIVFALDRGIDPSAPDVPLAFKAWINDWAGRKTHVMRVPVPYNGPDIDYKLKLDVLAQGANTQAGRNLDPNLMSQATVSGEALFDARVGLPSDARLRFTLSRAVGAVGENRTLSSQTILLRGFQDRIPFALSTASTNFDPLIPAPILNLKIIDRNNYVYFDSGDVRAREGPQQVQLYARR